MPISDAQDVIRDAHRRVAAGELASQRIEALWR